MRNSVKVSILLAALSLVLAGCHNGYGVGPDTAGPVISVPGATPLPGEDAVSIILPTIDAQGTPASDVIISDFLDSVSAVDGVEGLLAVTNDAPDVFPLGDTTVTFVATDSKGNESILSVVVTIADLTPPVLELPENITLQSSLEGGVAATRSEIERLLSEASASDNVDVTFSISNDAPTDFFPYGDTVIEFTATDAAGNVSTGTVTVTVILEVYLTDFRPATQEAQAHWIPALVNGQVLSTDLSIEPLNLLNLKNALEEGDFHTPTLNSRLGDLPTGSGVETAYISMFDGLDTVRDPGERHVLLELNYEWSSDGETVSIVVPAQIMDIVYINQLDTLINLTAENLQQNAFTVTREGIVYPETVDQAFLNALGKFTGLPLDELLETGFYTFQVISSLPFTFIDGSPITQIDAIVEISPEG